jgi:hypothetical protein
VNRVKGLHASRNVAPGASERPVTFAVSPSAQAQIAGEFVRIELLLAQIKEEADEARDIMLAAAETVTGRGFPSRVKRMALRTADGLASYAGPHSKCLARAEYRLVPSFVVRPPASKHFDRQRSGGQIAGEALARPTDCARSAPVES